MVELHEVPQMVQGPVHAYWFRRTSKPADVYVLAWAVEGQWQLRVPGAALVAMRPFGTPWPCPLQGNSSQILVGPRTYLLFQHTDADAVVRRLASAGLEPERS